MNDYQTIKIKTEGVVTTLWLSRPSVHNALNAQMIGEIVHFFKKADDIPDLRIILLRGEGESYCSGADLKWMGNAFKLSEADNLAESAALAGLFRVIAQSSKITISLVHGNTFGGGNGLIAACDLALGLNNATFSLSEARIGMAAATITPYLLTKISPSHLKELIFTAKRFSGSEAVHLGLLNHSYASASEMEMALNTMVNQILGNGRKALIESKRLINRISDPFATIKEEEVISLLAKIRISEEAREGFNAFLDKRKPNWE